MDYETYSTHAHDDPETLCLRQTPGPAGSGRTYSREELALTTEASPLSPEVTALRPDKGVHPILEQDHEYIFIDACMQAWPDADF